MLHGKTQLGPATQISSPKFLLRSDLNDHFARCIPVYSASPVTNDEMHMTMINVAMRQHRPLVPKERMSQKSAQLILLHLAE